MHVCLCVCMCICMYICIAQVERGIQIEFTLFFHSILSPLVHARPISFLTLFFKSPFITISHFYYSCPSMGSHPNVFLVNSTCILRIAILTGVCVCVCVCVKERER